ncbi:MAG: hypothetical protein QOH59_1274 [Gemmatimonadales bacterium]|jgi:hypothetical protein|nr:hypothetical protein [Gemmatimonadales bacterium]
MLNRRMLSIMFALACSIPVVAGAQVPADLQTAMKARDEALARGDAAAWDRLTTEDFTVVTPDGVLKNKAERLAQFKTEKPLGPSPLKQVQVKRYGDAVVRRFRVRDIWVMDVWTKDRDGWKVAAVQVTAAKK